MPATTLDDGGWGSIISNFGNALVPDPSNRAKMMLMGAQYQKTQLETEEQRRKMEALRQSIMGFPSTVPPELTLPPVGGQEEFGPVRPEAQQKWKTTREQMIRDNAAASNLARSADDFNKVFATRALGEIAGGIPADPARQDVLQTYLQTGGTSLPNYTTTPHTYQPMPGGVATGAPITSRRIPEGPAALASPAKLGPVNPFENDASMDKRLYELAQKALRNPDTLTIPELEETAVHLANRYGVKNVVGTGPDGSKTNTILRERPWPENFNPLVEKVAELNWYTGEKAAAAREGRPMNPPPASFRPTILGADGRPEVVTGGLVGGPPGAVAGAPGAAVAAPPAPPVTVGGLPLGADVGAPTRIAAGDATPLRKDFHDQPAFKKFEQAVLPFEQFKENVKVGTISADVALVYNLAKILDPESVVREGEMLIWKRTGGPADYLEGVYNKLVSGGSAMTPKVRADMADTAERAMQANHAGLKRVAERYTDIAKEMGVSPSLVVPKIPEFQKIDRKTISSILPEGAGPRGKPERAAPGYPPLGAPAAAPGGGGARPRTIRVNPDGSIVDVP